MHQLVIKSQSDTYKKNFKKFIRPDQIQACHWIREFNSVKTGIFRLNKLWMGEPLELSFQGITFIFVQCKESKHDAK